MTILVKERMASRSGSKGRNNDSEERGYWVKKTDSRDDALEAVEEEAPLILGNGLRRLNISNEVPKFIDEEHADGFWYFKVEYGSRPSVFEVGDEDWSTDFQSETVHVTQALSTRFRRKSEDNGQQANVVGTATDYKNAVNVTENGVEGASITVGRRRKTLRKMIAASDFTQAYEELLDHTQFHVNSDVITLDQGVYQPGEVLFIPSGARYVSSLKVELQLAFDIRKNETNISVGDITLPNKLGWEYNWATYKRAVDQANGQIIRVPEYAYVCQLYPEAAFANLLNPSAFNAAQGGGT